MNPKRLSFSWYYGWNVIAIALLFQSLCIGMSFYCFPLWIVPLSDEFQVSRSNIMLAIAASQIISGLISPFAGKALDRLPLHWVICGGAIVFVLGLLATAFAHAVWQLAFAFLVLMPIGIVLTGVMAAQTLATRWFTKDRGFALACATLGSSIGGFTMPPIAAALMTSIGWRNAIAIFAIAITLLLVVSWQILRKEPPHAETEDPIPTADVKTKQPPVWRTKDLLNDGNFQTIILSFFPLLFVGSAIQMNLGGFAQDSGLTPQDAAFMVAELPLCSLIGRIFFGKLVDRYDHALLYRIVAGGMMISLAVIIGASLGGTANLFWLKVGIAMLGLTSSGYVPLNSIVIATTFGTRAFGQATGLANTFLGLGVAGSFITASIRDLSGSYAFAFTLLLLLLIPGMWRIRKLNSGN